MMNNVPQNNAKTLLLLSAEDTAKKWANFMASQGVGTCLFKIEVPSNDGGFLHVGMHAEALDRLGYETVSHAAAPLGMAEIAPGQPPVMLMLVTLFVRKRAPTALVATV